MRVAWVVLGLLSVCGGVRAQPADPYQAMAIVTGTDMRQRPLGFARTFTEVMVKVSGDPRLAGDARVAALAAHADRLATKYGYVDPMAWLLHHDDQGTYDRSYNMTVHYDPAKIDAALATLGEKPWRGVRPVVVPVIRVEGRKPPPYALSAEVAAGAEQRGAFERVARDVGLTVRFPTEAQMSAWGDGGPPPADGVAVVSGSLVWRESAFGWVGDWRTTWQGREHRWRVSGVSFDDAFKNIVAGVVLLASGQGAPD